MPPQSLDLNKSKALQGYYDSLKDLARQGAGHEQATRIAFGSLLNDVSKTVGWTLAHTPMLLFRLLLLFLVASIISVHPCRANDSSAQGVGGNWQLLGTKHRDVQMVRETVRIELQDNNCYEVTADFWFLNHGEKQIVTMGFPESGGGDIGSDVVDGKASGFGEFTTSVDGNPVAVTRMARPHAHDKESYEALWIKKVPFEVSVK